MANRNSQAHASPAVTFSPEQLQAVIAQAIAEHEAKKAQVAKAEASTDMEKLTIAAFKRQKFTDIQPRVNVLTYARWVEKGFKVKAGEVAVKVKNLRLFHVSQVEPMGKKEQAEYLAKRADKLLAKGKPAQPEPAPVAKPKKAKAKVQPQPTPAA